MKKLVFVSMLLGAGVLTAADTPANPPKERVVFVCAHPDDLGGPSGTAILLARKFDVHVIDYTHGEGGCGKEGFLDGSTRRKRTREEEAACAVAGVTLHWLDEPNGHAEWGVPYCTAGRATCDRLAALFKELNPRAVILHWPIDTHPDHVMSTAAAFCALENIGRGSWTKNTPEIYFQEQTVQSKTFMPAYYVNITSVLEQKKELILKYECQGAAAMEQRKREDAVFRGRRCGFPYAEAFAVMENTVRSGHSIFDGIND